jgi:hypothetical protein
MGWYRPQTSVALCIHKLACSFLSILGFPLLVPPAPSTAGFLAWASCNVEVIFEAGCLQHQSRLSAPGQGCPDSLKQASASLPGVALRSQAREADDLSADIRGTRSLPGSHPAMSSSGEELPLATGTISDAPRSPCSAPALPEDALQSGRLSPGVFHQTQHSESASSGKGQTDGAENSADALTGLRVLDSPWFKAHLKVDAVRAILLCQLAATWAGGSDKGNVCFMHALAAHFVRDTASA